MNANAFYNLYYNNWGSNTASTTNVLYAYPSGTSSTPPVAYGDPLRGLRLIEEAAPAPETDMAWLKRRVNEICWVPR